MERIEISILVVIILFVLLGAIYSTDQYFKVRTCAFSAELIEAYQTFQNTKMYYQEVEPTGKQLAWTDLNMHAVKKSIKAWKKIQKLTILAEIYKLDSLPVNQWPRVVKILIIETIPEVYALESNFEQGIPKQAFNNDPDKTIGHIKNLWFKLNEFNKPTANEQSVFYF